MGLPSKLQALEDWEMIDLCWGALYPLCEHLYLLNLHDLWGDMAKNNRKDKLFNPDGLKHFRKQHSYKELYWGLLVLCVLVGIGSWIIWKGRHPAPDLLDDGTKWLAKSKIRVVVRPLHRITSSTKGIAQTARGPKRKPDVVMPAALSALRKQTFLGEGWKRKPFVRFSPKNLYEKINGRAGYFKSFGFKQLFYTSMLNRADGKSIDVEIYDQGKPSNALGTYAGELSSKVRPTVDKQGLSHISRNALYVSRGPYYFRIIGSDETAAMKKRLQELREYIQKNVPGEALPWAYGLFITMGIKASVISYYRENAFSFGFAKDVYGARIAKDTTLFICAKEDAKEAQQMAKQFALGWLSYGTKKAGKAGVTWVEDRYIHTHSTALAVERWVIGVQGATALAPAEKALIQLKKVVKAMPKALRLRAVPAEKRQPPPRKRPVVRPTTQKQPTSKRTTQPKYEGGADEK